MREESVGEKSAAKKGEMTKERRVCSQERVKIRLFLYFAAAPVLQVSQKSEGSTRGLASPLGAPKQWSTSPSPPIASYLFMQLPRVLSHFVSHNCTHKHPCAHIAL